MLPVVPLGCADLLCELRSCFVSSTRRTGGRPEAVRSCMEAGTSVDVPAADIVGELDDTFHGAGVELLCRKWPDRQEDLCPRKGVREMGDAIVFHRFQFAF